MNDILPYLDKKADISNLNGKIIAIFLFRVYYI